MATVRLAEVLDWWLQGLAIVGRWTWHCSFLFAQASETLKTAIIIYRVKCRRSWLEGVALIRWAQSMIGGFQHCSRPG